MSIKHAPCTTAVGKPPFLFSPARLPCFRHRRIVFNTSISAAVCDGCSIPAWQMWAMGTDKSDGTDKLVGTLRS